jgi:hypothetical protein
MNVCMIVPATHAADYRPGVMYSTLLNGVKMLHEDGRVTLDSIQAVFLPDAQSNSIYPYDPDTGGELWSVIRTASGTELYRLDWYAEKLKSPYWLLSSYKATDLRTGAGIPTGWLDLAQEGDYVLEFHLPGGMFYRFAFSVFAVRSADPFAGGDAWLLNGDWEDWGYIYYRNADPAQQMQFKVWLRNEGNASRDVKPTLEVRDSAGKLICTTRKMTLTLQPEWTRYELDFIFPMEGTSGGAYFKAQDLLAKDGAYTLTLKLDNELRGLWPFSVSGGKLVYTGRALRGSADPLTFIEGGRDAWWYSRK